ncbi:MAG: DUF4440 domain-containing protein [Pseudomonadota bacterium]
MTDPLASATAEIERLHAFISGWFRGEIDESAFGPDFADRLHPQFENIQPLGVVLTKPDLLEPIMQARGSNTDFRIAIREPRILGTWPGVILATYVEEQTGARNTVPPDNDRRSTVLFCVEGRALVWRHLQETALAK